MARFANKTFFKFLFGFILIVLISFIAIVGTSSLSEQETEKNTAKVTDEKECAEGDDC